MSLYATYLDGEPIGTRPKLILPEWDGCPAVWVQNVTIVEIMYWAARNELGAHVFRKRYMSHFYDTSFVVLGEPRATGAYSVEELVERDMLGVYAWRRGRGRG